VPPLPETRAAEWPRRITSRGRPQSGLSACPVCLSQELEYAFVVEKYPVCQCRHCSLLFLNPQPPDAAEAAPSRRGTSDSGRNEARRLFDRLLRYSRIDVRHILIVHAEAPLLEAEASSRGIRAVTIGPEASMQTLDPEGDNTFDAAILYGRLEQTPNPQQLLETVRRLLKPDATLAVNSASVDSMPARLLRHRWWEFSSRSYFYFGVNTLQNLLLKTGFHEPVCYADDGNDSSDRPRGWWTRFRDRVVLKLLAGPGRLSRRTLGTRVRRYLENRITILARPNPVQGPPKLSIIVPVYNERATFAQLAELVVNKQIQNVEIEIIMVESNSTDGTREDVVRYKDHPRVRVVLEDKPRGKGHAVRTGLQHATGDVILIQDADLEYDIHEYESLIWPILSYEQNFVIGSRHNALGRTWKIRKFSDSVGLSHLFNFGHVVFLTLFNKIYRQNLADPFSMFKVFRRDCLYGLDFECNRFDFDFELAIKLIRKGYRPIEIPINYQSRSIAEGKKVTLIRDPLTWIRALLKFRRSPLYARSDS
jgi:hypothetical protein